MRNNTKNVYVRLVLFLFVTCSIVSCDKQTEVDDSTRVLTPQSVDGIKIDTNIDTSVLPKRPGKNFQTVCTEGTVVLLFGYGYNSESLLSEVTTKIEERFGLSEKDGSLYCLQFPNDFLLSGNSNIGLLSEKLADKDVAALIILGDPLGTHKQLAKLQDEQCVYPIFSLFSQDDVLGTEAGSTAVFDVPCPQDTMLSEEETVVYQGDVVNLLFPLIAGILQNWKSFNNTDFFLYVSDQILLHTGCSLVQYIDPETGIKSENHYILVQEE